MEIYFDNSATTKMAPEVVDTINSFNDKYYANPSAMHRFGYLVEEEIKKATRVMSDLIGVSDKEIIWTSGATESNNLAIYGYAIAHKKIGTRIITTKIEHPSVSKVCERLAEEGFDIVYLSVDENGHIDIDELKEKIDDNTILVSIMYVNNEIGSVQDIDNIGKVIKDKNKNIAFHVDFVQGFGRYKINCKKSLIDFLSISSHKFNGPKGVGVLYKNESVRITPLILGGGQQGGIRSGTLNTFGIIGSAKAGEISYENMLKNNEKLLRFRDYLIDKLDNMSKKYDNIHINTKKTTGFSNHIVSVSFKNIRSEVMLHALEEKGIYVSAGSACSTHSKVASRTLDAIGLDKSFIDSTIRVSFGIYNELSEIDTFIEELDRLIPVLNIKKR